MPNQWFCVTDNGNNNIKAFTGKKWVRFSHPFATVISQIEVAWSHDDIEVRLIPVEFEKDYVVSTLDEYFDKSSYVTASSVTYQIYRQEFNIDDSDGFNPLEYSEIRLLCHAVASKRMDLFKSFYGPTQEASVHEMFYQLTQLFEHLDLIYAKKKITSYLIDVIPHIKRLAVNPYRGFTTWMLSITNKNGSLPSAHIHPDRTSSKGLITLLQNSSVKGPTFNWKKKPDLLSLLTQGEDPNQFNEWGAAPLHLAIHYFGTHEVQALLQYGADPRLRAAPFGSIFNTSPLEFARRLNKLDILNLMAIVLNGRPERALPQVYSHELFADNKSITTLMYYPENKFIRTQIKDLSKDDLSELFQIFKKIFQSQNPDKLKEIFKQDFSGENKYIEKIYYRNKLIGFNLFEIAQSKENPKLVIVHVCYSLINTEYRHMGNMAFLNFRFPFALQLLYPELDVAIFYAALTTNAYKFAFELFLHYPKHQPSHMDGLVGSVLKTLFNKDCLLQKASSSRFIIDDTLAVVGDGKPKSFDIMQDLYYTLRGAGNLLPVFSYPDSFSNLALNYSSAKIGINFDRHIQKLARVIQPLVKKSIRTNTQEERMVSLPIFPEKYTHRFWKSGKNPITDAPITRQFACKL